MLKFNLIVSSLLRHVLSNTREDGTFRYNFEVVRNQCGFLIMKFERLHKVSEYFVISTFNKKRVGGSAWTIRDLSRWFSRGISPRNLLIL